MYTQYIILEYRYCVLLYMSDLEVSTISSHIASQTNAKIETSHNRSSSLANRMINQKINQRQWFHPPLNRRQSLGVPHRVFI